MRERTSTLDPSSTDLTSLNLDLLSDVDESSGRVWFLSRATSAGSGRLKVVYPYTKEGVDDRSRRVFHYITRFHSGRPLVDLWRRVDTLTCRTNDDTIRRHGVVRLSVHFLYPSGTQER